MEAIEDARKAAEAEFGIVLRWCFDIPGEAGLESAEETVRLATDRQAPPGGPGLLRARRARDRRAAAAVQAVLRPGDRGRPALRAARRRDDGPGDGLGRADRPARRAHRARHELRPGPEAARAPRRAPHRRWRSARRPTSRPARSAPSTSTPSRSSSGPESSSRSTPTTRRCSAPTSTTSTRSPPASSTSTSGASPRSPRTRSRRRSSTTPGKAEARRGDRHVHLGLARCPDRLTTMGPCVP